MVEKFKQILQEIVKSKGPVGIFAVMMMDDLTDKWSVLVSAPWADESNSKEAFKFIFGLLLKHLDDEERNSIARIGILDKEEHLAKLLLERKKDSEINNEKVNGNMIHYGYILESNSGL